MHHTPDVGCTLQPNQGVLCVNNNDNILHLLFVNMSSPPAEIRDSSIELE